MYIVYMYLYYTFTFQKFNNLQMNMINTIFFKYLLCCKNNIKSQSCYYSYNIKKMLEKMEGQSRMHNPKTQVTLGTRHRIKTNKTENLKDKQLITFNNISAILLWQLVFFMVEEIRVPGEN